MSLLTIAVILIIIMVILWGVNRFIPGDANMKLLLNVVVIAGSFIWVLGALGVIPNYIKLK